MNEEPESKLNEVQNVEKQNKKIYDTRKKKIDFTRIGEKLSFSRNYCHSCRNLTTVQDSHSCRNFEKINTRKRICNKTFCKTCIKNIFPSFLSNLYNNDWICPCCKGVCNCSSCKKNKNKKNLENSNLSVSNNNSLSNGQNDKTEINVNNNLMENLASSKFDPKFFDWAGTLIKLLGKFNKEKYYPMPRPENDTIPKDYFLKLKRARDDFIVAKEKYFKEKEDKNQIVDKNNLKKKN